MRITKLVFRCSRAMARHEGDGETWKHSLLVHSFRTRRGMSCEAAVSARHHVRLAECGPCAWLYGCFPGPQGSRKEGGHAGIFMIRVLRRPVRWPGGSASCPPSAVPCNPAQHGKGYKSLTGCGVSTISKVLSRQN